jgi:PAS domain-containing protein
MTPSPRRARLVASWIAAAAVWCSVLAAAVSTGMRSNADGLHPTTAAALGSLGAACGGLLLWRAAARLRRSRRTPYFIIAAGVQVGAGSVAAVCWLPGDAGPLVAGMGMAVQITLFALALLRLPDDEWAPSAVLRRAIDGLFVGACLLFAFWLGFARAWYEANRVHTNAPDLAVIVPGILGGLLVGIGLTTTFRLTRWRRRHALAFSACFVVHVSSLALVSGWLWERPMAATLWWSVVWIGGTAALVGATRLALRQRPAIEKPNYPGVHYAVMGVAAVLATAVFLRHGADTGPLPLDAALLALVIAGALGGRLLLTFFDVRRATDDASDRQERLDAIVAVASDVVLVLDPDLVVTWHPEECAWQPATGDGRCIGASILDLIHPDDRETAADALRSMLDGRSTAGRVVLDVRMLDVHRRWRHTETVVTDRRGHPQVRGLVARSVDIGRRRSLETELNRMAYSDPLTGLANRRALLRRLENSVSEEGGKTALLLVDLDGFKNVNDTRGHDLGDEMLVEVSRRLRSLLRPTDLGARLGGLIASTRRPCARSCRQPPLRVPLSASARPLWCPWPSDAPSLHRFGRRRSM